MIQFQCFEIYGDLFCDLTCDLSGACSVYAWEYSATQWEGPGHLGRALMANAPLGSRSESVWWSDAGIAGCSVVLVLSVFIPLSWSEALPTAPPSPCSIQRRHMYFLMLWVFPLARGHTSAPSFYLWGHRVAHFTSRCVRAQACSQWTYFLFQELYFYWK